jgi:biopolymer transport protein ExbD
MNINKHYNINSYLIIVFITFVTIIFITSSIELSFAKTDNKNKVDDGKSKKHISISSLDKTKKKTLDDDDLKEPNIQDDILNSRYPYQFFICGYPQQIITDYNSLEKLNSCD